MKLFKALLVIAAIGFIADSNAEGIQVRAAPSCGEWVKSHSKEISSTQQTYMDEAWLVGFVSGVALGTKVDVLKNLDNESLFLYTTNFCSSQPLKNTVMAVFELMKEQRKTRK